MNSIEKAFKNGKAFIPFITCGDPDLKTTEEIVYALERAGADLIELGIPFSDPTAEGPTIQAANVRALSNKITTDDIFKLVKRIREKSDIPLAFMTYANVVFSYGIEKFLANSEESGISAIILPDVPFEEKEEFETVCNKHNISFISLIAPTSNDRIKIIAQNAKGFFYCVSSLGVTGIRSTFNSNIKGMIDSIKEVTDIPCAIGFGISTPEQAKAMAEISDGVIVGSAIVKLCEQYGKECVPYIEKFAKSIKAAISSI
jgi:tryptophan synthase alpha chain